MSTVPTIKHPAWCAPTRCTAEPTPSLEEYRQAGRSAFGEHQSAPIQGTGATVTARQVVCPWETSVFLTVADPAVPSLYVVVAADELVSALVALGLARAA